MADYIKDVASEKIKLDWALPLQRTNAFPLDRSSVFSSYDDAVLYASGGADERGLSGSAYVGQPISVYDEVSDTITLYIIEADRTLKAVGSAGVGDNASVEIVNGKIQLKNFGKGYFKYVPAVKDADGDVLIPATYEYTNGFINGLEPRVMESILDDGSKAYEIGWYEPSSDTVDGVNILIQALSQKVDNLEDLITGDTGLAGRVTALEKDKADASDVYTKDEVDDLISNATPNVDIGDWISKNRDTTPGLLSTADETKLDGIEAGAQKNLFDEVNSDEFEITPTATGKQLTIKEVTISQVKDLASELNGKVKQTDYDADKKSFQDDIGLINTKVTDLTSKLNDFVLQSVYDVDKAIIMESITWHNLDITTT